MFTGVIQRLGTVVGFERRKGGSARLTVAGVPRVAIGGSVAVHGVCLTVVGRKKTHAVFDVCAETLSRTNLGSLRLGNGIHLELPLRPIDPIDGHFVQGHVDGTGTVESLQRKGNDRSFEISVARSLLDFLVPKGSIAMDGVSLTLVEVWSDRFSVVLIPHTLEKTTLGERLRGDRVNLEVDLLAKYLHRFSRPRSSGITKAFLRRAGF